jgi:Putative MetA-pathway of phenol degradation
MERASSIGIRAAFALFATVLVIAPCSRITAQELEPRAYSPSPVGTAFLAMGFSRSTGGVTFDPSIPITDVHANLNAPVVGSGYTFGLLGRQALIAVTAPYVWGNVSGNVGNDSRYITRSGLGDARARFSINLLGSPALKPKEFAKASHRKVILATSIAVLAPTGQYVESKLINISSNRWAFKPELGFSYPIKKLSLDLYAGVLLFTENSNYYPGQSIRTQSPISSLQAHVSYTVRRGLWLAVDSTWYGGGVVQVNGGPGTARQDNSRLGVTASFPLGAWQSLKVSYSNGTTVRTGTNFQTIAVGWQHVWLRRD